MDPETALTDEAPRAGRRAPDAGGFDPLPWRDELRAFLLRTGAGDDVDDVLQEAFLRAVRRPPAGQPRAYLYRVVLNVLRDRNRKRRRGDVALPRAARADARTVPDPAEIVEGRDLVEHAAAVIAALPRRQRGALLLRIHRQLSHRETALHLGCSEGTARQHFHLAVKALRDALAGGTDAR